MIWGKPKKDIKLTLKLIVKLLFLFVLGGTIYCLIEIVYRGYTHWTMFILGGIAFLTCGSLNEVWEWSTPLITQMFTCSIIITLLEFITGCIVNIILGWNVWDYSDVPFNVWGQICLPYTIIWFFLSAVAIILDDYIRYWFFGEDKPKYIIFPRNVHHIIM